MLIQKLMLMHSDALLMLIQAMMCLLILIQDSVLMLTQKLMLMQTLTHFDADSEADVDDSDAL